MPDHSMNLIRMIVEHAAEQASELRESASGHRRKADEEEALALKLDALYAIAADTKQEPTT